MGRLTRHVLSAASGRPAATRSGIELDQPAFRDAIPICFAIADEQHHHYAPLLLSPYGYSTYRGS
jgi:5-hydroxyisourate hydrolase-like protein (transthyretin family)